MADFEHNSEKLGYFNLDELDGVQGALAKLGLDPGKADGMMGPKTRAAIRAFQKSAGVAVDGDLGPITRGALRDALDQKASAV
jgi:peptidoglycan hydrolase-like protein with peptidoglycan-binding domain